MSGPLPKRNSANRRRVVSDDEDWVCVPFFGIFKLFDPLLREYGIEELPWQGEADNGSDDSIPELGEPENERTIYKDLPCH
eukprot:1395338-Amorphochlora_amoeboformis.AAC.2